VGSATTADVVKEIDMGTGIQEVREALLKEMKQPFVSPEHFSELLRRLKLLKKIKD
jgi:hypothetical protein